MVFQALVIGSQICVQFSHLLTTITYTSTVLKMGTEKNFQGVVCCSLDTVCSIQDSVIKVLDLNRSSNHHGTKCYELDLSNKYYTATIHLFDLNKASDDQEIQQSLLENSYAIILCGDGMSLTTEKLDNKLEALEKVNGEPRILLCNNIDEECESHKTLLDWSINNGFNLILLNDPEVKQQLVDSLSAYRWIHRTNRSTQNSQEKPELDREVLRKLMDFDSLLNKLSAYRDQPELRGNPDDKNIEEIAEILSGLLGDDVDDFLEAEDHGDVPVAGKDRQDPQS